ncbi:Transcription initiation factor IIA subunit 2 [Sorochytrium milnesiophthora]
MSASASNTDSYQLYRQCTLGTCLSDALDELIQTAQIQPQLALRVMEHYDKAISDALANRVQAKCSFKAHLHTYRFCDEVWTFVIKDAMFRFENESVNADKIKIVACNARAPAT